MLSFTDRVSFKCVNFSLKPWTQMRRNFQEITAESESTASSVCMIWNALNPETAECVTDYLDKEWLVIGPEQRQQALYLLGGSERTVCSIRSKERKRSFSLSSWLYKILDFQEENPSEIVKVSFGHYWTFIILRSELPGTQSWDLEPSLVLIYTSDCKHEWILVVFQLLYCRTASA